MGRKRHGSITKECPEVIGVLNYLHVKGTEYGLDLDGYDAEALAVLRELQAEKRMGDPTVCNEVISVITGEDSDEDFYLTTAPDMV
jgi:hypothetical protein